MPISAVKATMPPRSLDKILHLEQELGDMGISNPPVFFFRSLYLKSPAQYKGFCGFYKYVMEKFRDALKEAGTGDEEHLTFNIIPPSVSMIMRVDFNRLIQKFDMNEDQWCQFFNESLRGIKLAVDVDGKRIVYQELSFAEYKEIEESIRLRNREIYMAGGELISFELINSILTLSLLDVHTFQIKPAQVRWKLFEDLAPSL
ncbi:hypothetical protein A2526_02160 [candidate division WOR-1 bacterium RIFOXYD2_FULL_36_8]|nr:MAG: hypothetical protein A2230_06240 [candidate division WOR-1 bacterium RIFOXYA2_FULL_36_21]OGC16223.1 MAG: hypothetical protein A2282_01275 [candidate division WOR-1 bacterium RIFOXYA12_FULL_36_13]OGC38333.1 MAG: hypothetical protein A2526_02160 [candidate division WOR-1 bacterium RIFOXYD2_FULL_36_8]